MARKKKGERAKINYIKRLEKFKESCGTCEFNFDGVCAGGKYGEEIYDLDDICGSFHIGIGSVIEFGNIGKLDLLPRPNSL